MEQTPNIFFCSANALRHIFYGLRVFETFVWVFVLVFCAFGFQHCLGVGCEMDDPLFDVVVALFGCLQTYAVPSGNL